MEAALERSARAAGVGPTSELQFCAQCEMPLLDHAAFCNACGTAVRVQPKATRPKVGAVLTTARPDESIVPGFDSPIAGEQPSASGQANPLAPDETTIREDTSSEADEARDRFYDEEEGRP
jgi:hypothetical protein